MRNEVSAKILFGAASGIFFALFVFLSCSPTTRFRTLSFFFDGVPDPNRVVFVDTVAVDTTANPLEFNRPKEQFFFHPPYQERNCGLCHDLRASQRLVESQLELCYQCHDDFAKSFKVLHGPVEAGFCTACHNPHRTKIKKLLKREGQELCLYCHSLQDVKKNEVHEEIDDVDCTECHNPHGGEDRTFLQ